MNKLTAHYSLVGLVIFISLALMVIGTPGRIAQSADSTPTSFPAATLIPVGTSNKAWTPQEQNFNGVSMVLVPAGCFMMGSTESQIDYAFELAKKYSSDAKREWFDNEKPVHEVCFDQPFWIDRTEVTQAQFRQFGGTAASIPSFAGDNRPVEQITWFEARNFCTQRGVRLPTEAEWEYAARGPDSLIFPWGNEFVADNAVYVGNSKGETSNVGSRAKGVSWVGALDMSGNVWEWTNTIYDEEKFPYSYKADDGRESTDDINSKRVLRGGGWNFNAYFVRTVYRFWSPPGNLGWNGGFRCARDHT